MDMTNRKRWDAGLAYISDFAGIKETVKELLFTNTMRIGKNTKSGIDWEVHNDRKRKNAEWGMV